LAQASVSRQEAGLLLKLLVHPEPEVRSAALAVMAATADNARPPPVTAQVEVGRKCSFGYAKAKMFTKILLTISLRLLHISDYKICEHLRENSQNTKILLSRLYAVFAG
jgi:hypothetical protein